MKYENSKVTDNKNVYRKNNSMLLIFYLTNVISVTLYGTIFFENIINYMCFELLIRLLPKFSNDIGV